MFYIVLIACVALDQLTKWLVSSNMDLGQSIPVLGDFFSITYIVNRGASFSLFEGRRWLFVVLTLVVLLLVFWLLRRVPKNYKRLRMAVAVFCGGTIGNLIDRIVSGAVVDFLHIYIGAFDYNFPIFNIADCCIDIAVICIVAFLLFGKEKVLLEA